MSHAPDDNRKADLSGRKVSAELHWKDGKLAGIHIAGMLPSGGDSASGTPMPGKMSVQFDWLDNRLADVRVRGAFLDDGRPNSKARHVFKAENKGDQARLVADHTACPAWVEYSADGAPIRIELLHGTDGSSTAAPEGGQTLIALDWKDGMLAGFRIKGGSKIESGPDLSDRRVFRVRRRGNEVSLLADATTERDDQLPGLDGRDNTVRAFDKAIHEVEKRIKALDSAWRRDSVDLANAVLDAAWQAQTRPERVNAALPLVFIAQVPRSGGTLLSQLFDGHPEVWSFPLELEWNGEEKDRWPTIDPRAQEPLRIASSLMAGNIEKTKIYNVFGYQKRKHIGDEQRLPFRWSQRTYVSAFIDGWMENPPQSRRECFDIFMSAFFSALLDRRDRNESKKIVCAFAPRMNFVQTHPANEAFFEDYPDGLMLSLCRHPADWYASATVGKTATLASWRESAECALQLKQRHPDQVVLISLETLITNPGKVMRKLAERVGIAWNPILTIPTFNGMLVSSNSSFHPVAGIDESVLRRRDMLPTSVRDEIEAEYLPLYRQFIGAADL
jgi:Sulfotransferase family